MAGTFGETGTKATWSNPVVTPEASRANGGWYYNPASGSVDRWWGTGGTTTPATSGASSGTGYNPQSFESALSSVAGKVNEAYQPGMDVLNQGLAKTEANTLQREQLAREELPIIQQRYKTLLDELNTKSEESMADIKGVGNAAINETRARAGATGIYSSGIEIGQEANIGALTAKTLRGAAGDYETNKQKYIGMQSEEELNLKKNILDIVSQGDESSLKLRQAIAAIGPEKLNTSITLAAQILAQDRAEAELGIKFSEEARAEALFPLQKAKLSAEISQIGKKSSTDIQSEYASQLAKEVAGTTGLSLTDAQTKYAGKISTADIVKIYQGSTGRGPVEELWAKEILGTTTKLEPGEIKDGSEIGMTAGIKYQYTDYGWTQMTYSKPKD
jgi:hypothetical protein